MKNHIDDLAIFGGPALFSVPKSTSNLLQPDFEKFLNYSKLFFEQRQYTNNGPNILLLEKRLADFHKVNHCITFSSGFWALALTISKVALKGKSEIIMPSLTYRRMADIAAWVKLVPRFCEVETQSLAMSANTVRPHINQNTALILGAHPIVNCCETTELEELAKEHDLPLVFDSVESVYESTIDGRIGGFGRAEAFSLHACKLINGFGGGYITTNDPDLAHHLSLARAFGFSGKDNIVMGGAMNAKLNELHAAMALASLDDLSEQIERNRRRYHLYKKLLAPIEEIRLLEYDEEFETGFKNIVVALREAWPLSRGETIGALNAERILARAYYSPPLHQKPMAFPFIKGDLPVTDRLASGFLNLPCGHMVDEEDIGKIVTFLDFLSRNATEVRKRLTQQDSERTPAV